MAPVTDLAFEGLNIANGEDAPIFLRMTNANNEFSLFLDVSVLLGKLVSDSTEEGVVSLMVLLHDLCQKAQGTANLEQSPDDLLAAFPPPTSSGTFVDGKLLQINAIHSKILTSSATQIEGLTT